MPLMPDLVSSLRERNTWAPDRLLLQRFGGKVDRGLALELLLRRPTPWHLYHPMASPPRRHMSPGTLNIPCHRGYAMPSSGLSLFAPVLTGDSGQDESSTETGDKGTLQTGPRPRPRSTLEGGS